MIFKAVVKTTFIFVKDICDSKKLLIVLKGNAFTWLEISKFGHATTRHFR